jgi:hypothetical protein
MDILSWRNAFPSQILYGPDQYVSFLQTIKNNDTEYTIIMNKINVECSLTEDNLIFNLNNIVSTFIHTSKGKDRADLIKADNDVAKRSLRGKANFEWNGSRYYCSNRILNNMKNGTNDLYDNTDGPLVVAEYNGKFGIALHPNFDDYGYRITNF